MKIIKNLIIISIVFFIILNFCNILESNAVDTSWVSPSNTITSDQQKVLDLGSVIFGMIRTVGTIASVIILIIVGIKYMLSSLEEKAKQQQMIIRYVIGAVILFAVTNLVTLVYNVVGEL